MDSGKKNIYAYPFSNFEFRSVLHVYVIVDSFYFGYVVFLLVLS